MNRLGTTLMGCAFVWAALGAATARADFYKWVDEKGVTHYSESPPDTGQAKRVDIAPSPPSATRPPVDWKAKEAEVRRQRLRKEQADAQAGEVDAKRKDECLEAQRRLDLLAKGRPLYRVNERGERVYMEDAQRDTESKRWTDQAKASCD